MGLKKFFKIKPPEEDTPEQNREYLNEMGIATKGDSKRRPQKFSAYGKYANDKAKSKFYAPPGYEQYARPQEEAQQLDDLNKSPYDQNSLVNQDRSYSDPYGNSFSNNLGSISGPYGAAARGSGDYVNSGQNQRSPYEPASHNSETYGSTSHIYERNYADSRTATNLAKVSNPYAGMETVAYGSGNNTSSTESNPYSSMNPDTYSSSDIQKPYNNSLARNNGANSSLDSNKEHGDELNLNETISRKEENDDLNNSIHEDQNFIGYQSFEDVQKQQQVQQQREEDQEVDAIKQQIRFTKQSSVASTRNTLKMAQDAEMAGMNTLGMLGNQSEKLNNVERNLNLMKIQNRTADDKVAELKKLNRNILAVHVSNPFHSKRRAKEAEEKIKLQRIQDKRMQEEASSTLHQSTQRIESAMNQHSEVRERYQNQEILQRAKRYQFENDEDDNEMEVEIDRNLDKIGQISGRLKKLAIETGKEIDSQQDRIKKIENDTDDLDIKIHVNTTRLTNIR